MSLLTAVQRPHPPRVEPVSAQPEQIAGTTWPTGAHTLIAVLSLAGTTFALMQAIVVPALPRIQAELATSTAGAAWLSTAYLLSASVLTPMIGRLGDTVGLKRMMLIVLAGFGAGTVVCALASTLPELIAGRLLQGGAGGIYPLAFAIIRQRLPRERVAPSIGLVSSLLGVGGGLGLILPGPIMNHLSYHWLFWLALIPICITLALAARCIPADGRDTLRVPTPWGSAALMAMGLSLLLVAVSESSTWRWSSPRTLSALIAGAAVLATWVQREARSPNPLVNMTLMRRRAVATANVSAFTVGLAMYASFLIIPEFVQAPRKLGFGFGASVTVAGLFMLPTAATQLVLGPAAAVFHRRLGIRRELLIGQLSCAGGFGLLAALHADAWQIYLGTTVIGVGFFLCLVALPNQIVEAVPLASTGSATAVNTVVRNAGGALGGQVAAVLIIGSSHAGIPGESGYVIALLVCAAAAALGVVAALIAPEERMACPPPCDDRRQQRHRRGPDHHHQTGATCALRHFQPSARQPERRSE